MWVAVFVVGVMLVMQVLPVVLSRKAVGKPVPELVPELVPFLNETQKQASRLLVYFWSPTCAVCRPMSKAIDAIGSDSIVKVNVMEAMPLAQAFHVMGTPSVAVVEGGVVKALQVGARSEAQLRGLLQSST